jgi:hypothetical protein
MNLTLTIPESEQPPITVEVGGTTELTSYETQVESLPDYPSTFPPAIGSAANQAVAGNDPRLTNERAPTAHTHPLAELTGVTPAAIGAVETTSLSTNGGANKVPQFDANGDLRFSGSAPAGTAASLGGVFLQDLERLWFLNTNRTDGGSAFYHTAHDIYGGELQVNSPHRMALCLGVNGALQLGLSLQDSKQYVFLQKRGNATALNTTTRSIPLYFNSTYWNGSQAVGGHQPKIQAVPDGTTGSTFLDIYNPAQTPPENGTDGTETLAVRVSVDGVWEKGKSPEFVTLTPSGSAISQSCSIYKSVQVAKVQLAVNSTLSIGSATAGMRGVIYVRQPYSGAALTLTLPTNSAIPSTWPAGRADLSTTSAAYDRLSWEFDGVYYYWSVTKGITIPLDSDVTAFVAAGRANITDAGQQSALNDLVIALKESNVAGTGTLWSKFTCLYPFIGGNATAHSRNLKSTSYDITWVNDNALRHSANGVTGDVASGFHGNSNINANAFGQNNVFLYSYCKTQTPASSGGWLFGITNGVTSRIGGIVNSAGGSFDCSANSTAEASGPLGGADWRKHLAINRAASGSYDIIINSAKTTVTTTSVAPVALPIYLFSRGAANYTPVNQAFIAFGSSLTDAEQSAFRTIIAAYQTALGRANP